MIGNSVALMWLEQLVAYEELDCHGNNGHTNFLLYERKLSFEVLPSPCVPLSIFGYSYYVSCVCSTIVLIISVSFQL